MRIQAWTPFFTPEKETLIVPVWILQPGLAWHCFRKPFITPLLETVVKVLYMDTTSFKRYKVGMARMKLQIYLTKPRPIHVWIGLNDDDDIIGIWKLFENENIPLYCEYYKYQGHYIEECIFKMRDDEYRLIKEKEYEKKTKKRKPNKKNEKRQGEDKVVREQKQQHNKEGNKQK